MAVQQDETRRAIDITITTMGRGKFFFLNARTHFGLIGKKGIRTTMNDAALLLQMGLLPSDKAHLKSN